MMKIWILALPILWKRAEMSGLILRDLHDIFVTVLDDENPGPDSLVGIKTAYETWLSRNARPLSVS